MLQAFIITLREGVEAALIIGIVFAYLNKIGRHELKRTVFYGIAAALIASIGVAIAVSHFQFNQDIIEGWVMLVAAFFVVSMIWFMQRTARHLKGDIETKIANLTASPIGLFFFVFLLVLREGTETVLILSAVSLNSTELLSFIGTLLGLIVSVIFGVMFIRGSVRINLQRFFRVTTVILYFVTFQLVVSGLHELSENGVLPSSKSEMSFIGPIVRNDLFFFITMLALTGLMMLFEYRRRTPEPIAADATAADRRRIQWQARRERIWTTAVIIASFTFIFLSTAEFIYAKSVTALSPAQEVTLVGNTVTLPLSAINDDQLHRYTINVDGTSVRFLLYKKPNGEVVSVADACMICGGAGFYVGSQGIICKMCSSPLNPQSVGAPGGCNPVPLHSTQSGGQLYIAANDLRNLTGVFSK